MKKLFLILLVFLVAGAWVGQKMLQDSGYVLISYNQTTIETTLWVMLIIMCLGFLLGHWLLNIISRTRLPTAKFQSWKDNRNQRISRRKTLKGLALLSEGNWSQAQKQLAQAAEKSDLPMINYLSAARAAHEQNDEQATDELLQKARNSTPEAEVTVAITQAEIQLSRGQLEPCLATLLKLRTLAPRNTYVMKLLKDVYIELNDWQALSQLMPTLRKSNALKDKELAALSKQCCLQLLNGSITNLPASATNEERLKSLGKAWSNLPTEQTRNSDIVQRYTELLVSLGAESSAEMNLRELIKRDWNETLVGLYGSIHSDNPKKQLDQALAWLKEHSESPALLLSLGRLSLRNKHWGQAVKYFEQSLAINPSTEALAELSRLLQHLGEEERANKLLQQNLHMFASDLPELPMPDHQ